MVLMILTGYMTMVGTSPWVFSISNSLESSFPWPAVYPLILSRGPKIARKPVRTGPTSSSLIKIGA